MERPTILLTLALVLVGCCSTAIIWNQRNRIQALKAHGWDADTERAALRKRLAAVEQPGPVRAPTEFESPEEPRIEEPLRRPGGGDPRASGALRNRGVAMFAEMMADPEVSALMITQRKAGLDSRYAALFRQFGLDPKETEALKNLLAERQLARLEAGMIARADGLGRADRDEMRELTREADNDIEEKLRGMLGADRFNTFKACEHTAGERARVDQFALRLSYSPTPMQPYQADAMVQVLASVRQPPFPDRGATAQETAAYEDARQAYDAEVCSRAQSVLSPVQLESLRHFQQEQADLARLRAIIPGRIREGFNGRPRHGG